MMRFDYASAHTFLVTPAFHKLSNSVQDCITLTIALAGDCVQGPSLNVLWPENPALRAKLEALDSRTLAIAACTVWAFGHWEPLSNAIQKNGIYWKFSNYCDQILRIRLVGKMVASVHQLAIHEGMLRVCYATIDSFQSVELCWATEENLDKLNQFNVGDSWSSLRRAVVSRDCKRWLDATKKYRIEDRY